MYRDYSLIIFGKTVPKKKKCCQCSAWDPRDLASNSQSYKPQSFVFTAEIDWCRQKAKSCQLHSGKLSFCACSVESIAGANLWGLALKKYIFREVNFVAWKERRFFKGYICRKLLFEKDVVFCRLKHICRI